MVSFALKSFFPRIALTNCLPYLMLHQFLTLKLWKAKSIKLPAGKKPGAAAFQPTPKFTSLCKAIEEV